MKPPLLPSIPRPSFFILSRPKLLFQADKPFSIFCDDENAGVCKKVAPARAPLSTLPSLPAPALLRQVESFDSSSASMETDSPMVVDLEESLALPSLASAHTPAPDTADILAAPEYCKVGEEQFSV